MAEINLKYNPYTREVERCQINGDDKVFTGVWGDQTRELGEWAYPFIEKLDATYNDDRYVIAFTGIERDFNFLQDAAAEYMNKVPGVTMTVKPESIQAVDKGFDELRKLFDIMQAESPFQELKSNTVKELFEEALSSEFEMAVVATMSSGKSTLINAMLCRDLLPARAAATTSNIVRIHDIDGKKDFKAVAKNGDGVELETIENITPEDLDRLNSLGNDESKENYVSVCELYGDIPGIDSTNVRLVLTDTPGPNNSQNVAHREHTYSLFKKDYKPLILYVLNASQLGTNDDSLLLDRVAEAMAETGRQSQDRFIFVLNKADEFDPEKGETLEKNIDDVRTYLEQRKIMNPRIFPCDARSAKVFRQYLNGQPLTETEEDDILPRHSKIVKREWRHFSRLSPLSKANVAQQQKMLLAAAHENDETIKSIKQAIVYTGVPAIELAINEYLMKYALPAKLSKAVDSFKRKIVKLRLEAKAESELKGNERKIAELQRSLEEVEKLLSSGELGKKIAEDLKGIDIRKTVNQKFEDASAKVFTAYQHRVGNYKVPSMDPLVAQQCAGQIHSALQDVQAEFKVDIDDAIKDGVRECLTETLKKLNSAIRGLLGPQSGFDIGSAISILDDCEMDFDDSIHDYTFNESKKTGTRWVENTDKHWYKPWTWFQADGWNEDVFTDVEKINFLKFVEERIEPQVESFITYSRELIDKFATGESVRLRDYLTGQIKLIQQKIQEKVESKRKLLADKDRFERELEQNEKSLEWLQQLKCKIDLILAI